MKVVVRIFILLLLLIMIVPSLSWASTPLSEESPGSIITFSDKEWIILKQIEDGTTYILLRSNYKDKAFDTDNDQLFNPNDPNNIGYYLNNTFYESLSQKVLIKNHSWSIKSEDGSSIQSSLTAKVGLISYDEYQYYSSYYNGNILSSNYEYNWWTRTPYSSDSNFTWSVIKSGNLHPTPAYYENRGVRPALYLQSGIQVSDTKEVIGATGDVEPPSIPTGFSGSAAGPTDIELSWDANNEQDLQGYKIYRDGELIDQVIENNYADSSLVPEKEYNYTISAFDTSGNESEQSEQVTIITPAQEDKTPPAVPTGLQATAIDSNKIEITWDDNAEPDFASYDIYRNGEKITSTATNSHIDINLDPETAYSYTVSAGDLSANYSDQCDPVMVITPAAVPELVAPPNVQVNNITDIQAILSWDTVNGAEEYKIYINGTEFSVTSETPYSLDLDPQTEYIVTIAALTGEQEGPESNPLSFTTLEQPSTVPGIPYFSTNTSVIGGVVRLSWSLNDNTINKWQVYKDGILVGEYPSDTTGTTIKGLENGTYDFKIRAVNSIGPGEFSNTLQVNVASVAGFTANLSDIFIMIGLLIKSIWPLLVFAIALSVMPKLVSMIKNSLALRR